MRNFPIFPTTMGERFRFGRSEIRDAVNGGGLFEEIEYHEWGEGHKKPLEQTRPFTTKSAPIPGKRKIILGDD